MKRNVSITKIMTTDVQTVHLGQKLSEVRTTMMAGKFHHVPVVSGKKLLGILSATDLLKASYQVDTDERQVDAVLDHTVSIENLMQKYPVTLRVNQTVRDAVAIFAEGMFHGLPVIDDEENLVGVVTTTDVIRYMLEQY